MTTSRASARCQNCRSARRTCRQSAIVELTNRRKASGDISIRNQATGSGTTRQVSQNRWATVRPPDLNCPSISFNHEWRRFTTAVASTALASAASSAAWSVAPSRP